MPIEPSRGDAPIEREVDQTIGEASAQRGLLLRVIRDQRTAFLLVGAFNTVLGWALFAVAQVLIGQQLGRFGYMVSLYASYAASIFCAFLLHRTFVFRVRGHFWLDLGRFTIVNLVGLGLNTVLLPLAIEAVHLPPIVAQACVALAVAAISYGGHKYFSFRRADRHDSAA